VGDTAVFFQCNSNVLLVLGQTDKMFLGSYVCTKKKDLKLEEAVKKRELLMMDRSLKQAGMNLKGMAANNTTQANGLKMKFKTIHSRRDYSLCSSLAICICTNRE